MKLPSTAVISAEKIKNYLLKPRKRNDKSKWLAKAGYALANWQQLEKDLWTQILSLDAVPTDKTIFGQVFEIRGELKGPTEKTLLIWMREYESNLSKFITMFPDKSEVSMKYELFKEVVLLKDIPERKLKNGDVATIVEHHPSDTSEDGYSLEVFNVFGATIAVVVVAESEIEKLKESEVFSVRSLEAA